MSTLDIHRLSIYLHASIRLSASYLRPPIPALNPRVLEEYTIINYNVLAVTGRISCIKYNNMHAITTYLVDSVSQCSSPLCSYWTSYSYTKYGYVYQYGLRSSDKQEYKKI